MSVVMAGMGVAGRVVMTLCLVSQVTTSSSNTAHLVQLVLGVFSPPNTSWEEVVNSIWSQELRPQLTHVSGNEIAVEFVFYTKTYDLNLDDAQNLEKIFDSDSVSAIIAPYMPVLKLVAQKVHIPYIITTMTTQQEVTSWNQYSLNLLPPPHTVHAAILDLVKAFKWQELVAVIYDGPEGLHLMGELMEDTRLSVRGWNMGTESGPTVIRNHMLEIRQLSYRQIILYCDPLLKEQILDTALRLSMLSKMYSYVSVSLDPTTTDYIPYSYTLVNLTTFQLYDPTIVHPSNTSSQTLQAAVSRDALHLLTSSFLMYLNDVDITQCPPFCTLSHVVKGEELLSYIRDMPLNGSTGHIEFDNDSFRTNITLQVTALMDTGIEKIGEWRQKDQQRRLHISRWGGDETTEATPHVLLGKGRIKIVTIKEAPFVTYKNGCESNSTSYACSGNRKFEGFLIDLIEEIAKVMEFQGSYDLYESPDNKYGSKGDDGQWNGMIRELIIGNASMCLGAISITSEREEVVDFTKPFKQKMFSLLMKKPEEKSSIFQFLWPLAPYVWILITSSVAIVGFLLFVMDRLSPNSESSRTGRFNMSESLWFIYGSLVGAGTEMVPRTISGRLLTGSWWFFALILVSSYTANLAAFLTVTKIDTPIKNVGDLAMQTKIKYGTVKNTYSSSMFNSSKIDIFRKMWAFMNNIHPDSMVDNAEAGLKKVQQGDYAFIWDAPINKYTTQIHCDTMMVGEPFDEKGYGIGVPMGAAYRDAITMAILNLNEEGTIQRLERKWWGQGLCEEFHETSTKDTKELRLENVAGVFLVLACGAFLALMVSLCEFFCRRNEPKRKMTCNKSNYNERSNGDVDSRLVQATTI